MGILLVNIISFSMPEAAYISPLAWGGTSTADLTAWTIVRLVFEGRMRGLFALLFGASTMLVMARAQSDGRSPVATHLRRMAALAVFGLAHCYLVWDGDILVHYALLGSVLWLARDWSIRRLLTAATIVILLHTLYWTVTFGGALALQMLVTAPDADPALVRSYTAMMRSFPGPDSPGIARYLEIFRGSYPQIVHFRLTERTGVPIELLKYLGGETLGFMLIGMALFKSGLLTGKWSRAAIGRLMIVSYAVSLPVIAILTAWAWVSGLNIIVLMGNFLAWSIPARVICTIGHVALIVWLVDRFATSALIGRIGAAGRMAFTNYLATSLVMTTIFYGYGLGLFGHVGRAEVYLFVAGMWLAMLAWSQPWLARFAYGPFEWLWRSLSRGRLQPIRRPKSLASASQYT